MTLDLDREVRILFQDIDDFIEGGIGTGHQDSLVDLEFDVFENAKCR